MGVLPFLMSAAARGGSRYLATQDQLEALAEEKRRQLVREQLQADQLSLQREEQQRIGDYQSRTLAREEAQDTENRANQAWAQYLTLKSRNRMDETPEETFVFSQREKALRELLGLPEPPAQISGEAGQTGRSLTPTQVDEATKWAAELQPLGPELGTQALRARYEARGWGSPDTSRQSAQVNAARDQVVSALTGLMVPQNPAGFGAGAWIANKLPDVTLKQKGLAELAGLPMEVGRKAMTEGQEKQEYDRAYRLATSGDVRDVRLAWDITKDLLNRGVDPDQPLMKDLLGKLYSWNNPSAQGAVVSPMGPTNTPAGSGSVAPVTVKPNPNYTPGSSEPQFYFPNLTTGDKGTGAPPKGYGENIPAKTQYQADQIQLGQDRVQAARDKVAAYKAEKAKDRASKDGGKNNRLATGASVLAYAGKLRSEKMSLRKMIGRATDPDYRRELQKEIDNRDAALQMLEPIIQEVLTGQKQAGTPTKTAPPPPVDWGQINKDAHADLAKLKRDPGGLDKEGMYQAMKAKYPSYSRDDFNRDYRKVR